MFPSNPYVGQRHIEQNKEFMFNSEGWVPVQRQVTSGGAPVPENEAHIISQILTDDSYNIITDSAGNIIIVN